MKDMLLKQCLELTTNNDLRPPISTYNGVDIDDVVRTCKQLQDKKTYLDLVKENESLKKHLEVPKHCNLKTLEDYKSYYEDTTKEEILKDTYIDYCAYVNLAHEYAKLKKQLEYLRSGEYYNQLRFERDMLQNIVDNGEVSKEDKEFIDMTHRNTQLLEENQELKKQFEEFKEMHKTMARYALDNEAKINELENQQKEFIEYLENMIKIYNRELIVTSAHGNYDMHEEIRKNIKKYYQNIKK